MSKPNPYFDTLSKQQEVSTKTQIKQTSCVLNKMKLSPLLSGQPLKLEHKFTHLDSNISSTENDVDIHIAKSGAPINRLSLIWKSDLSDKIKRDYFQTIIVSLLLWSCTTITNQTLGKKARWELHKKVI